MSLEEKQFSHYRILQLIGRGGMGEVYVLEDLQVHRQVAAKFIRSEQQVSAHALRLFWREATAIARLDHPAILPLYDHGEAVIDETSVVYLIMPYRPEGSLVDWLRKRPHSEPSRSLTLSQVAHLIQQAGQALQYAHDHQVMHLDVKPANFLVRSRNESDDFPNLLLSDFGIARLADATTAASQHVIGTPPYMAPEQWANEPTIASDQYALAIMAYELLTGSPPFQGGQMQVMFAHVHEQPKPACSLNPLLPSSVDPVLLRALAKKPEERFSSVQAFADALTQASQDQNQRRHDSSENAPPVADTTAEKRKDAYEMAALPEPPARPITIKGGDVVDGVIVRIDQDEILVDIGLKLEGMLPTNELPAAGDWSFDRLHLHDKLRVYVIQPETPKRRALLSLIRATQEAGPQRISRRQSFQANQPSSTDKGVSSGAVGSAKNSGGGKDVPTSSASEKRQWRFLEKQYGNGEWLKANVTGYTPGGLKVDISGIHGFVPLTEIPDLPDDNGKAAHQLSKMVGKKLSLKIIEIDRKENRLILSKRPDVDEEAGPQRVERRRSFQPGQPLSPDKAVSSRAVGPTETSIGAKDVLAHSATEEIQWRILEKQYLNSEPLKARVTSYTLQGGFAKDGLKVDVSGIRGFVPLSEILDLPVDESKWAVKLQTMISKELPLKITEIDSKRNHLTLSQRLAVPQGRRRVSLSAPLPSAYPYHQPGKQETPHSFSASKSKYFSQYREPLPLLSREQKVTDPSVEDFARWMIVAVFLAVVLYLIFYLIIKMFV